MNTLSKMFDWICSVQERRAAWATAQYLTSNNQDFKAWSAHELYTAILNKDFPVNIDKSPRSA
jgi:hypothetical protein